MNDFQELYNIEEHILDVCTPIGDQVANADTDTLNDFLESVGELGMILESFARETTEWNCFETCIQHDEQLKTLFERILAIIESRDDSISYE